MRRLPGLNDLRVFETAARLRNFRQAAEQLHLTHGAVSHRIRALEEQLGVVLFDRKNDMQLTEAGLELLTAASEAMGVLAGAVERISQHYGRQTCSVHLSLLPSFATRWFMPRVGDFNVKHPGFSIQIESLAELTTFGEYGVDAAVRCGTGGWKDLHVEHLMDEHYYPVATPAFIEKHSVRGIEDLLVLPLIAHIVTNDIGVSWSRLFSALDLPTTQTMAATLVDDHHLGLQAAELGLGVALARHTLAHDSIVTGKLQRLFSCGMRGNFKHYFVSPQEPNESPCFRAFLTWLHAQCDAFTTNSVPYLNDIHWLDDAPVQQE